MQEFPPLCPNNVEANSPAISGAGANLSCSRLCESLNLSNHSHGIIHLQMELRYLEGCVHGCGFISADF